MPCVSLPSHIISSLRPFRAFYTSRFGQRLGDPWSKTQMSRVIFRSLVRCNSAKLIPFHGQLNNFHKVIDCKSMATSSTGSDTTPYTLSFYVPTTSTDIVLAAVHTTGAGSYPGGLYDRCAFMTTGTGTFRSLEKSTPAIGAANEVTRVEEHRVEVLCVGRQCMLRAVEKLKEAHPYEQVAYFVVKGEEV